jgi:hypothetical protein
MITKIPIIHLHGQLGLLPWQFDSNSRAFDGIVSEQNIRIAASGIKVVHEGVENRKKQFGEAKELIRLAKRVYFLGVGTSNVNMDRLDVISLPEGKASATEVGLTQTEYNEVVSRYATKIEFRRNHDCREMVSNFVQWS